MNGVFGTSAAAVGDRHARPYTPVHALRQLRRGGGGGVCANARQPPDRYAGSTQAPPGRRPRAYTGGQTATAAAAAAASAAVRRGPLRYDCTADNPSTRSLTTTDTKHTHKHTLTQTNRQAVYSDKLTHRRSTHTYTQIHVETRACPSPPPTLPCPGVRARHPRSARPASSAPAAPLPVSSRTQCPSGRRRRAVAAAAAARAAIVSVVVAVVRDRRPRCLLVRLPPPSPSFRAGLVCASTPSSQPQQCARAAGGAGRGVCSCR